MFVLTAVLAIGSFPLPALTQEAQPARLESRVRTAALFKNGLAFVRREARFDGEARAVELDALPVPVHGSFWIAADPARLSVGSAVARRSEVFDPTLAVTIEQLLRANVGREVTLTLMENESLTGTLVAVPELEPEAQRERAPWRPEPANLLLLRTSTGMAALAPSWVRRISAPDLKQEYDLRREAVSLTLSLTPTGAGSSDLSILYIERGLTWAPSYTIDVSDPERATMTAKAVVIDEAEDLENATLQFVTGFPNLQFSHVVDPIAMQGDLDAFLNALGQSGPNVPQVAAQFVSNFSVEADFQGGRFPVAGDPNEGASVEDLFFYEQKGVTLKRGERGLYPLFTVTVPYEHLYEWSIADTIENRSRDESAQAEIWHSVRLTNDTRVPWTTAPAMTMKDGHLLGQDTLRYAAVGGRTTVRITRAVDVQGEQAEYEIARDRNSSSFYGRNYDQVTVRGEIRAINHKREPMRLEIKKQIQGALKKNPDGAVATTVAEGLRQVNPTVRLTWSKQLEPGEPTVLGYEYTLFVRP